MPPANPTGIRTVIPCTRYTAEGCWVKVDGETIIVCRNGPNGVKAEAIAERVAELLNRDFERFVQSVAASIPDGQTG